MQVRLQNIYLFISKYLGHICTSRSLGHSHRSTERDEYAFDQEANLCGMFEEAVGSEQEI